MAACGTCGVALTMWNRSIGSSTCADCSRGTSPAAQQKAVFDLFARSPSLTEESLVSRSIGSSAPILIGAGLLAEGIYFAGTLVVDALTRNKGNTLATMIAFALGYGIAGVLVTRSPYPIDVARWRTFANTLAVVVAIGVIASIALGPVAAIGSLPFGLGLGMVGVVLTDDGRKKTLLAQYRAYRAAQLPPA